MIERFNETEIEYRFEFWIYRLKIEVFPTSNHMTGREKEREREKVDMMSIYLRCDRMSDRIYPNKSLSEWWVCVCVLLH